MLDDISEFALVAPRGSPTGPDNWPRRWEDKAKALETVDWSTFRRNPVLMEGIQTRPSHFDIWYQRAKLIGVEPEYFEDVGFGHPEGREIDGAFVTANSLRMSCYAAIVHAYWEPWRQPFRVLDIGGGFGGMAIALWNFLRPDVYFLMDSYPCMRMQYFYLSKTVPRMRVVEWSSAEGDFDLVVNTNSLGEMDLPEVARYFEIIETNLVDGGAFYTQNRTQRVTDFRRYPYGPGWRHVLVRHPFGDRSWAEVLSIRDRSANSPHPWEMLK